MFDNGGAPGSLQKRSWNYGALTPDGKHMVGNALPVVPGAIPPGPAGLVDTTTGQIVPNSGLDGLRLGLPAFAPNGTLLAYVDVDASGAPHALRAFDFNAQTLKATNGRDLVQQGTGAAIVNPSVSPDAKWIVYHRGAIDTRNGNGDLFL